MPKKKTHEEFLNDVKIKYGDKYIVLGEYKNASTKIKIKCNNCGHEKMVRPYSFIRQKIGCKECYHNVRKLSFNDINIRLEKETNGTYKLISTGKDTREKMRVKHNCGYEYYVSFGSFFYAGKRCRKCYGTAPLNENEFLNFFKTEMKGYELLSKFEKFRDKITIKHLKCGKIYSVEPRSIKNNLSRCSCEQSSVGERKIRNFLNENKISFVEQYRIEDCKNKNPLPFDFKISFNKHIFLLEYQGIQHFEVVDFFGEESFKKTKVNDEIKYNYCKDNNINLEYINYNENLEEKLVEILNKYANLEPS